MDNYGNIKEFRMGDKPKKLDLKNYMEAYLITQNLKSEGIV